MANRQFCPEAVVHALRHKYHTTPSNLKLKWSVILFVYNKSTAFTEEEFNTVKEAMLDVYKKIKNNDLDFLLEDDEEGPDPDTDPNAETDDAFAADYDEDDEDDE